MSYILNKTDGSILTELVDGILDTDTTDISLVGRNYTGYGEFINENFIQMLENFSNTNPPVSPLTGQIWYDTNIDKLKVYDGEEFVPAAGSFVSPDRPQDPTTGDTWYKSDDDQLYLYDGNDFRLIGPQFNALQGQSGVIVRTILDNNLNARTVLELRVGTSLQAVISAIDFIPNNTPGNIIPQLVTTQNPTGRIREGFNIIDPVNFVFRGSVSTTEALIAPDGEQILPTQFLRNDENGILLGSLSVRSAAGIILGPSQNTRFIVSDGLTIQNTQVDDNINFVVNSSTSGLSSTPALTIRTQEQAVGIFTGNPQYTLDVNGDARITGDLLVEGDTVTVQVETLQVEDKNIELAVSATPTDLIADGGGLTLRGDTDKTINWVNATAAWTSSEDFDLANTKEYLINGTPVLGANRLYDGITQATGLTQIGTLTSLTVDTITLDNSTIGRTGSNTGLTIAANGGDISVTNSNITQVANPTQLDHAANKSYVDQQLRVDPLVFALDVTGWVQPDIRNERIEAYLEQVFPATTTINGKTANVITFYYEDQLVENIDVAANSNKVFEEVEVNAAAGGTVTVLEDIGLPNNLTGTYTPTVTRETRTFEIVGGAWKFQGPPLPTP
jgi:hypothetical protein